jgi:hypothetical protein
MINLNKTSDCMWLKADTTVEAIRPDNGTDFSFKELQGYVGGYIEIVRLPNNYILVVDEEGLLKQKKLNKKASELAGQPIVGDVVLCKSKMVR